MAIGYANNYTSIVRRFDVNNGDPWHHGASLIVCNNMPFWVTRYSLMADLTRGPK